MGLLDAPGYHKPSTGIPAADLAAASVTKAKLAEPMWVPSDAGLLACSFDPAAGAGITTMATAGRLEVVRLSRVPVGTITNIHFSVFTAGSGLTSGQCFAALFNAAGTLLSATADQSGVWNSAATVWKTMPLAAAQVNAAVADFFVAWYYNGTTGPTLIRGASSISVNSGLSGSNSRFATADTGRTTSMPSSLGALTASSLSWLVALS